MSVILDEKYGVNPTMSNCFYCGKEKDIILVGRANKKMYDAGLCSPDGEMKKSIGVIDMEPCSECAKYMEDGIIIVSVKDGDTNDNPYRTGNMVVVQEDFIQRATDEPLTSDILKKRFTYMEDEVWNALGFPKGDEDETI